MPVTRSKKKRAAGGSADPEVHVISDDDEVVVLEGQTELEKARAELERVKAELEQTKAELENTKTELTETKTELGQTQERLEQVEAGYTWYKIQREDHCRRMLDLAEALKEHTKCMDDDLKGSCVPKHLIEQEKPRVAAVQAGLEELAKP